MSHNTSSMKGLMLYGRRHYQLTRRSHPWCSHPMVYGCGCAVVGKPNRFTTSAEMRFFWLPLSIMNYSGEPFTHIWEWKRCSSSSRSSGSSFWIFVMARVALGSALIICFPLSFPLSGFDSYLEHASDSKTFSSATNDCLARHSLVLWVELLWNSHHFPMSFFGFRALFFTCSFGRFSWATPPWLCILLFGLGAPFPCFGFEDPKSRFFCLNFCLTLMAYRYAVSSEGMFRNSISSYMYLCRQPWYLSIKCCSESLIPNFAWMVWKIVVNSGTSWSLPCYNVVHFMYWSL